MRFTSRRFACLSSSIHHGDETVITGISYDSRTVSKGFLYIAIKGSRVDGNDFIPQAVASGASAVLVDRNHEAVACRRCLPCGVAVIAADNPAGALSRFSSIQILSNRKFTGIAVTGSCGKTTTKEMIASILSTRFRVARTPGNLNSTLGLPLAVLTMDDEADFGVFEMGVDHYGEMDAMTRIIQPELAVLTNIGISHLENFETREGIAREKGRIFLPQTQGFILDDNDMKDILYSMSPGIRTVSCPFEDVEMLGLDGIAMSLGSRRFVMPTVGMHNVKDASLAVALARHVGMRDDEIIDGLSSLKPLFGRSRVVHQGSLTVIEDCYNATLDSVDDAIRTVSGLEWKADKLIVLGDMRELGSASRDAHRQVGRSLCTARCDHILLYGDEMEEAYRVLYDSGRRDVVYTRRFDVLSSSLRKKASSGDLVLLKGSRAMAMERLFETLKEVG